MNDLEFKRRIEDGECYHLFECCFEKLTEEQKQIIKNL